MSDPCTLVTSGIFTRLSDNAIGFNANYLSAITDYTEQDGGPIPNITIDWAAASANFAYGLLPPDLVEESSPFTYPLLTISADLAQSYPAGNSRRVHYQRFSGMVTGIVQIHLSWMESGIRDFETWPNAVIGAMLTTMNAPSISAPTVANSWGTGVLYGYDLSARKGNILMAGENWRRTITFSGSFEVHIS
jgi:hypothetical protein